MPLLLGLVIVGVGVRFAIIDSGHGHLQLSTVALLSGGLFLWLLAFYLIQALTYPPTQAKKIKPVYGLVTALLLIAAGLSTILPAWLTITLIAGIFSGLAYVDMRRRDRQPSRSYLTSEGEGAVKIYRGKEVIVTFDSSLCIHSGECLRRLPQVFDLRQKPWVQVNQSDAASVIEAVHHCPSKALQVKKEE